MIEKKTKELGGIEFTFSPLMAGQARLMLDKLIKTFGGVLAATVSGADGVNIEEVKALDLDKSQEPELIKVFASAIGGGLGAFSQAITPEFHTELVDTFLKQVTFIDPDTRESRGLTKNVREVMFSTRLALETRVLLWCITEQYGDFLEPVRRLINSAPQVSLAVKE